MNDLPWQTIDTAPKDGEQIALWCQGAQALLLTCRWKAGRERWECYGPSEFDGHGWQRLEPYEIPTHWLRITPPDPCTTPRSTTAT